MNMENDESGTGVDKVRVARVASWFSWAALVALQAMDAFLLQAPWFTWLVKLLPLLLFLPGMWRDNLRSFIWVSFVSLGYFVVLVQRLFAQPGSYYAISAMVAVVVLFTATMLYVRWRARELRSIASRDTAVGD